MRMADKLPGARKLMVSGGIATRPRNSPDRSLNLA